MYKRMIEFLDEKRKGEAKRGKREHTEADAEQSDEQRRRVNVYYGMVGVFSTMEGRII